MYVFFAGYIPAEHEYVAFHFGCGLFQLLFPPAGYGYARTFRCTSGRNRFPYSCAASCDEDNLIF